jgi:hypothetical protein
MAPPFLPGMQVVTDNHFIFAALLLGNRRTSNDSESRPTRTDGLSPQKLRWTL